ncbi:hypothetical protein Tco_1030681 [Tanacetum coccineum]|uniref:Uncharacterized protein n=1 Tax=Tanacetum coccineum TaxID=301880 RepID=A0ABQ5G7E8_9ASTR
MLIQRRRQLNNNFPLREHLNKTAFVERRNRTLVEAARTMLSASKLPLSFWAEAHRLNHNDKEMSVEIVSQRPRSIGQKASDYDKL